MLFRLFCTALMAVFGAVQAQSQTVNVTSIEPQDTGMAKATVVENAALAHTSLVTPVDADGALLHDGDEAAQARAVFDALDTVLATGGASLGSVVKLNVYMVNEDIRAVVEALLAETYAEAHKPAVTYVVNGLPVGGALVAMDAVAFSLANPGAVTHHRADGVYAPDRQAHLTMLPRGRIVYIAGQAEDGETLQDAAANTLGSLMDTLAFLGLNASHVVQTKSFLKPIHESAQVDAAIAAVFPKGLIPVTVHVEWTYGPKVEIEMIAYAPAGTATQAEGRAAYLTPPGMTESPVFSRLCVVDSDRIIYVSGLYGEDAGDAEGEVREIFAELEPLLQKAGSDLRHMAKATYYCSTDETSAKLNAIRPEFYDPKRPPAASKSGAHGVGMKGKGIAIDMIAVPAVD